MPKLNYLTGPQNMKIMFKKNVNIVNSNCRNRCEKYLFNHNCPNQCHRANK